MTAPAPVWSIAGVEFHIGDCRELLPALLPRADAIATDPPYGIGGTRHGTDRGVKPGRSRMKDSLRASGYDGYPVTAIPGDETTPVLPSALLNFPRLAVFGAQHFARQLPPDGAWHVWDKTGAGRFGGRDDYADAELVWVSRRRSAQIHAQMWKGVCTDKQGELPGHFRRRWPAQKPVRLMAWVLGLLDVAAGETVIDPYAGSGTTALAAMRMGARAILIDLAPETAPWRHTKPWQRETPRPGSTTTAAEIDHDFRRPTPPLLAGRRSLAPSRSGANPSLWQGLP